MLFPPAALTREGDAAETYIESFARPGHPGQRAITDNRLAEHDVQPPGPAPRAENDFAATPEETPVRLNVLGNDRPGSRGDGKDDDDHDDEDDDDDDDDDDRDSFRINPATVDLDPDQPGRQTSRATAEGTYNVDDTGYVTFSPALNYFGNTAIQYTVQSFGGVSSNRATLAIGVSNVNDAPVVTGQHVVTIAENQALVITPAHLVINDPDDGAFTVSVGAGSNYAVSGQTVTPDPDFSGTLNVPVAVHDGEHSSTSYILQITVTAANERPVITGQTTLITDEDTPLTVTLSNIHVSDADNSYPSGFTFRLLPGNAYTIDGGVIIPDANFSGALRVPVVVNDGTDDSEPFNLEVTVRAVNDAPAIAGQVPLSTPENQPITLSLAHLVVNDPDNDYPGSFGLSVLTGDNYSASGSQITPAPSFNGVLTVQVFVNDGSANSNIFAVHISVTPVNDPPVITGQRALTVVEDTPITLALADLIVTDKDNTYPTGFTLAVQPGENYAFTGTTVTPSTDFTGTLNVAVVVNDGRSNSLPFSLAISVTPQNDPPQITGPPNLTTNEDTPLTIALTDLQVSDPDNPYPAGFSLLVFPGANYSSAGNTITPDQNYSGPLSVEMQVSDGSLTSNIFTITVNVLSVNDPPMITGQVPVSTNEDVPVTLQLSHLSVLDVDNAYPAGFSIVVSPGSNYTVAGAVVTPATDFNGTLNVSVMVNDGFANSAPFNFQIQVGNSNDAPQITGQMPLSTDEETPVTLGLSHLAVADPDNAYPAGFSLLVSPGVNYSVSGPTITPAIDFAGVLSVPVRVNDGINNSPTFNFSVQVNQVNDPPVFAAIPNQQISENGSAGSIVVTGISKGPMEQDQQLTFVATSGNTTVIRDPVIQYGGGSTATLSYSVVPNASGVVTITIIAIDNGSNVPPNQNSYSASFQIEVLEINSAPTLDIINNITIMEDAEQQNVALTGITPGPGETQSLTVGVTSNRPDFFDLLEVAYTSPEESGLLRFKTKTNMYGTVELSVTVKDNGPGTGRNVNRIIRNFTLVVQPVNDPPVFTSQPLTVAVVNETYEYRVRVADPDGERVSISAPTKPGWAALAGGNNEAVLKGKPPAEALGNTEVKLIAQDAATVVEQTFTLYVNVRPVITSLAIATEEDTPIAFSAEFFRGGYTDVNDNALLAIFIMTLPAMGQLSVSDIPVKVGDTIHVSALSDLIYVPAENFFGTDSFGWKASDGYHASVAQARVDISIISVNDPPQILFQSDTLHYEVNGEPALLAPLADIVDPDDDSLTNASVGFSSGNYRPEMDLLQFKTTGGINGVFDFQSGMLRLSGKAPVSDYLTVLRSLEYLHQNTLDPVLEPKIVSFALNDGETASLPAEKIIMLQYTFIEFEIPSGFTPNGDAANDTWVIDRPGGGLGEMNDALISVYNKHGVLVYRTKGFDRPWDGTMDGQLLPADTYFYIIDLRLRNNKTYKGIVTILR